MSVEQGESRRTLLKRPVGVPGTTEHERRFLSRFFHYVYDMRMLLHTSDIGFSTELAELFGHLFEIGDTEGLPVNDQHFVPQQRLAQLGIALNAQST